MCAIDSKIDLNTIKQLTFFFHNSGQSARICPLSLPLLSICVWSINRSVFREFRLLNASETAEKQVKAFGPSFPNHPGKNGLML